MGSREAAPVRDSQAEAGAQHGIVLKHTCPLGQRIAEPTLQGGNNGGRVDSVVQVLAVQQIPDGLDFRPHLAPRALEICHGAPIAPPSEHHQARAHDAHRPPHHEQRPVEAQSPVAEQQPIEHEESHRERRERAARRAVRLHRTGWRPAGETMNAALAPAPSPPRVVAPSRTCGPRDFTTYAPASVLPRFSAWASAWRFRSATVVSGPTARNTWSHTSVTITRTANRSATAVTRPPPPTRAARS